MMAAHEDPWTELARTAEDLRAARRRLEARLTIGELAVEWEASLTAENARLRRLLGEPAPRHLRLVDNALGHLDVFS